jgi:hypothetical protein
MTNVKTQSSNQTAKKQQKQNKYLSFFSLVIDLAFEL